MPDALDHNGYRWIMADDPRCYHCNRPALIERGMDAAAQHMAVPQRWFLVRTTPQGRQVCKTCALDNLVVADALANIQSRHARIRSGSSIEQIRQQRAELLDKWQKLMALERDAILLNQRLMAVRSGHDSSRFLLNELMLVGVGYWRAAGAHIANHLGNVTGPDLGQANLAFERTYLGVREAFLVWRAALMKGIAWHTSHLVQQAMLKHARQRRAQLASLESAAQASVQLAAERDGIPCLAYESTRPMPAEPSLAVLAQQQQASAQAWAQQEAERDRQRRRPRSFQQVLRARLGVFRQRLRLLRNWQLERAAARAANAKKSWQAYLKRVQGYHDRCFDKTCHLCGQRCSQECCRNFLSSRRAVSGMLRQMAGINPINHATIEDPAMRVDDAGSNKPGYRACSPASWDNAVRVWEDDR